MELKRYRKREKEIERKRHGTRSNIIIAYDSLLIIISRGNKITMASNWCKLHRPVEGLQKHTTLAVQRHNQSIKTPRKAYVDDNQLYRRHAAQTLTQRPSSQHGAFLRTKASTTMTDSLIQLSAKRLADSGVLQKGSVFPACLQCVVHWRGGKKWDSINMDGIPNAVYRSRFSSQFVMVKHSLYRFLVSTLQYRSSVLPILVLWCVIIKVHVTMAISISL